MYRDFDKVTVKEELTVLFKNTEMLKKTEKDKTLRPNVIF